MGSGHQKFILWENNYHIYYKIIFMGRECAIDESGKDISKSIPTTKRRSSHLRKTLYQIVYTYPCKDPAEASRCISS